MFKVENIRDRKEIPQVLFVFPSEKEGGRGLRPLKTLNLRKNLRKTGGEGGKINLRKTTLYKANHLAISNNPSLIFNNQIIFIFYIKVFLKHFFKLISPHVNQPINTISLYINQHYKVHQNWIARTTSHMDVPTFGARVYTPHFCSLAFNPPLFFKSHSQNLHIKKGRMCFVPYVTFQINKSQLCKRTHFYLSYGKF